MNLKDDLEEVRAGRPPTSILALVQMGYATFPPAQLTEHGLRVLQELQELQKLRDAPQDVS